MTELPLPAQMNELARALQYIPHVDQIKFGDMHAPAEEIQEFFYGMQKAMYAKKIIHSLRQRIDKKNREQGPNHANPGAVRRLSLRTNVAGDRYQSPDWSNAEAILRHGSKLPVSMVTGKIAPRSPVSEELPPSVRPPDFKLHSFLNLFSVAWSLDFSSMKGLSSRVWYRYGSANTHTPGEKGAIGQPSGEMNLRKRSPAVASVVFAAMAEHERRTQTLERLMWIATVLCICIILFALHEW